MNKIILMGRLTKDPDMWHGKGEDAMTVARYSLAVDKPQKRDDGRTDYFQIVAFDKKGEFAEKYLKKGTKMLISGHVQTGTYDKDGIKMPFFEVVADEQEFAESKHDDTSAERQPKEKSSDDDYDLPFIKGGLCNGSDVV